MIPVILSGGSGTRLWPLSRAQFPKQFHALSGDQSLLCQTLSRLDGLPGVAEPLVVCNNEHRFLVAEQLRGMGCKASIVLEPLGRNTAPAIAVAVLRALQDGGDPLMLVLPSDQVIGSVESFQAAVRIASEAAVNGWLVTFGVVPTHPETGYGYIRRSPSGPVTNCYRVEAFVEKPVQEVAEAYCASGQYLWNGGMFMFRASAMCEELDRLAPEVMKAARSAFEGAKTDMDFLRLDATAFQQSPDISIDYAVMERSERVAVVPLDAGWSDLGSWSALWDVAEKDASGNASCGEALLVDAKNCLVRGDAGRLVAVVGVDDLVVVDTDDAIMVTARGRSQDVKKLVDELKRRKLPHTNAHRKVFRPWGFYDSIGNGERYQVKRIVVSPGAKLSVQMHHHRAEHWVVVQGTALVRRGDESFLVSENQSTYIPVGVVHCLENPGVIPLEMIEVQSGSYLGEDDIVRFEDRYGRA